MQFLRVLEIEGSIEGVRESGKVKGALEPIFRRIRVKVLTGGQLSDWGVESSNLERRRNLLIFLGSVNCDTPEEETIYNALLESDGNMAAAARELGVDANQIVYFLQKQGYYRK